MVGVSANLFQVLQQAPIYIIRVWTHSGTVVGHHTATSGMSVAAAASYNRLNGEPFTSQGQPTILFSPLGVPLAAPDTRQKPDFTSIDGCTTSFFGEDLYQDGQGDPDGGFLFSGTSAAAPNAA